MRVNISEKIKKVIKDKGVKDSEFALSTGIAIDRVRNLCQGKIKKIQPHEKEAICRAYEIRPEWWENDVLPPYLVATENKKTPPKANDVSSSYEAKKTLGGDGEFTALAMLAGLATSSAAWLPADMKQRDKVELGMKLNLWLRLFVGDDLKKMDYLLDCPDFMDRALRLIYELETRKAGV